jgi:DNA-directed RNA polymerase subunit RPC12/RpoP
MRASKNAFACEECGAPMEPIGGVPVLQSLQGHAVHRCEDCGHILLVQKDREPEWSAEWLGPLFMDCEPPISCVTLM